MTTTESSGIPAFLERFLWDHAPDWITPIVRTQLYQALAEQVGQEIDREIYRMLVAEAEE